MFLERNKYTLYRSLMHKIHQCETIFTKTKWRTNLGDIFIRRDDAATQKQFGRESVSAN